MEKATDDHAPPQERRKNVDRRITARRAGDAVKQQNLKEHQRKLQSFLELGQLIGLDLNLDEMLLQIAKKATEVMEADRFSIFLHDRKTDELWTKVAVGMEGKVVRIPAGTGVSGYCFRTGETVNLADAYTDPRFYQQIDVETNYRTKTLLSMPCYSRSGKILGVIQLINKKDGLFTDEDEAFLRMFNNHAAVFIEMAQLQKARFSALEKSQKELERLSRAKDKALHHLSHELRTPLAVIQGTIRLLKRRLEVQGSPQLKGSFEMLERHLARLFEIQQETDKIIRTYQEIDGGLLFGELDRLWRQLEDVSEIPREVEAHWDALKKWIAGYLIDSHISEKPTPLLPFVKRVLEKVKRQSTHREITFQLEGQDNLSMFIEPEIPAGILEGLLKNAVENTPDGGLIRIMLIEDNGKARLKVQDFGIGITQENQKSIFEGFFYTQATDLYASKKPYDFGAGGKGLDLLLAKIYGQRFGFQITFESKRCIYIPTDKDLCPGKILLCTHCKGIEDCIASGGSTFTVSFAIAKKMVYK